MKSGKHIEINVVRVIKLAIMNCKNGVYFPKHTTSKGLSDLLLFLKYNEEDAHAGLFPFEMSCIEILEKDFSVSFNQFTTWMKEAEKKNVQKADE